MWMAVCAEQVSEEDEDDEKNRKEWHFSLLCKKAIETSITVDLQSNWLENDGK